MYPCVNVKPRGSSCCLCMREREREGVREIERKSKRPPLNSMTSWKAFRMNDGRSGRAEKLCLGKIEFDQLKDFSTLLYTPTEHPKASSP